MTTLTSVPVRFPSFASVLVTRATIELKQFVRDRDSMLWCFGFPLIFLALFSVIMGGDIAYSEDSSLTITTAGLLLPGMLAYGFLTSSFQNLGAVIADEREKDNLKRLRATPLPPVAYFAGKIVQVLAVTLVQAALLLALAALAFDVALPTDPTVWLTFAWLLVLGSASGSVLGIAFSSLPRTAKAASNLSSGLLIILAFVSGVFIVTDQMPQWLTWVSQAFPLYWLVQGMRAVLMPEPWAAAFSGGAPVHLGLVAAVLAGWTLVGLAVCVRTFRWTSRHAG